MGYIPSIDAETINISLAEASRKAMQADPFHSLAEASRKAMQADPFHSLVEEAKRQHAMLEYIEKSQQAMLARADMLARLDARRWKC